MPLSDYVLSLRSKIDNDLLFLPSVCGLVFNDKNELLLGLRADNGIWSPIGGSIEPEEQPADAVVREVLEETNILCLPERITGVYLTPTATYSNGHRAQFIITTFVCRHLEGTPTPADGENLEVRYFPLDQLPPVCPHHRERIEHALTVASAFFVPAQSSLGR